MSAAILKAALLTRTDDRSRKKASWALAHSAELI